MSAPLNINASNNVPSLNINRRWRIRQIRLTCRVSRIWRLHSRNDCEPTNLQFLAIDTTGMAFLCDIKKEFVHLFERVLKHGLVYDIQNFEVAEFGRLQRVVHDRPYYMILDSFTEVQRVFFAIPPILRYKFHLIPYNELISFSNNNSNLCDVIGQISILTENGVKMIGSTQVRIHKAKLTDLSGRALDVTLCTRDRPEDTNTALDGSNRVCILTSMVVTQDENGLPPVMTSCATQIYATFAIQEIREFHIRLLDSIVLPEDIREDTLSLENKQEDVGAPANQNFVDDCDTAHVVISEQPTVKSANVRSDRRRCYNDGSSSGEHEGSDIEAAIDEFGRQLKKFKKAFFD